MHVLIIGNGVAGASAAVELRKKSNCTITLLSDEHPYFFSRTALMYVYMGQLLFEHTEVFERDFWKKNTISLLQAQLTQINFKEQFIILHNGEKINYDKLVLATGSIPKKLNIDGEHFKGVQYLYSKQDLDKLEQNSKNVKEAIVVGGGLIGVELCEMLLSRGIEVHFFIKEKYFWNSVLPDTDASFVQNYLKQIPRLHLHNNQVVNEIIGDENGNLKGIKTKKGDFFSCQLLGVCIGVEPNISCIKNTELKTNRGILVNEFLETSIDNVYAIGDCAELIFPEKNRKSIEAIWYSAKNMGICVSSTLAGPKNMYEQGIWTNSAKFFELEFQCVGLVKSTLDDMENEFVWKNEKKNQLLHFIFEKDSTKFLAVNAIGLRIRQKTFEKWIKEETTIIEVLKNLRLALFDSEFSKDISKEVFRLFSKIIFHTNEAI
ncbi:MAG: FAD-dependent oxidoreductase [Flavobacteriia bacterium]|nr:FAD-dependent oxidoreductase [Flavobacteriia bacterium]